LPPIASRLRRRPVSWLLLLLLTGVLLAGASAFVSDDPADADAVSRWNAIAFDTGATLERGTTQAREMAMTHLAIHDALNSIHPRFATYTHGPRAPADASPDAAIAAAARTVLDATVPHQADVVDRAYADALAGIPDGQAKQDGIAAGEAAAQRILALRRDDGAHRADCPYTVRPGVGIWEPTPPDHRRALLPDWAKVRPFLIGDPAQVLPPPPPALTSARYARDYAEVAALGGEDSTVRTAEQTATARFWAGNVVGSWNEIARNAVRDRNADIDARHHLDPWQTARLYALLNAAMSDGFVAGWYAKYRYHAWRPVTAIQRGDTDGNPKTAPDPHWMALLPTPEHPEYPSTHSVLSATGAGVLDCALGEDRADVIVSDDGHWWRTSRHYPSFQATARKVAESRLYAGAHFRYANEAGLGQGQRIATIACGGLQRTQRTTAMAPH
jgi:hypothetical protein